VGYSPVPSNHVFSCSTVFGNGLYGHCHIQLQGTTDRKLFLLFIFHKRSMGTASSRSQCQSFLSHHMYTHTNYCTEITK